MSGVDFVMDYFTLQYEDIYVTVINPWRLRLEGSEYAEGTPGFRDALCAGINHMVTSTEVIPNQSLTIALGNSWRLEIMLRPQDYIYGSEGVIIGDDKRNMAVY